MTTPGLSGVYKWLYAGGSFTVCLRPSGVFYCKEYSSSAQWVVSPSGISIDWKNYGQYELNIVGSGQLEGSIKGKPASWRKMSFLRPFDECENLMMGNGAGTAWNFEYDKGSFEVEFRCDGFNHFICQKYPAHSHWSMEENKLLVNWDRYGMCRAISPLHSKFAC